MRRQSAVACRRPGDDHRYRPGGHAGPGMAPHPGSAHIAAWPDPV